MKKYIIIFCCILSTGLYAQKKHTINQKKVPGIVITTVQEKSGGAAIEEWTVKGNQYYAKYQSKAGKCTIKVDKEGKWQKTETRIGVSSLPMSIRKYVLEHHPEYMLSKASKIEKPENAYYKVRIKSDKDKQNLKFTLEGQLIPGQKKEMGSDAG